MRAAFQRFIDAGQAMTLADVAFVLKMKVDFVRREARAQRIPRIPGTGRLYRFDPSKLMDLYCDPPKQDRSLTTEKRKSGGNPSKGGFRNVC